jgi:hypothetical protein
MIFDFTEFQAQVQAENREWIPWYPSSILEIHFQPLDTSRYIARHDWPEAVNFITDVSRPNLVLELLSNSEALASSGYRRSAIIEAITALEVAVTRFADAPEIDSFLETSISSRVDVSALGNQVEHLGLSGTMRYLLPLLFSDSLLPTSLVSQCQQAIRIRGNVVHQGQRDIDPEILMPMLKSIRDTCNILASFTKKQEAG